MKLRWIALALSLVIEAVVFWVAGPLADPDATFLSNLSMKAASAASWTWLGFVSLSLAWLFPELARAAGAFQTRRLRRDMNDQEDIVYDTGVHWLVLLRDIRFGNLNDGKQEELEKALFDRQQSRSFTWYAVWIPVWIAALTLLFFAGWIAWLVSAVPTALSAWSHRAQDFLSLHLMDGFAFVGIPAAWLLAALPGWLAAFHVAAGEKTLLLLGLLLAFWWAIHLLQQVFARFFILALIMRLIAWLTLLALLLAVASTPAFDWVAPIYTLLPNNGPVAMGFFPLALASAFYLLPHVANWSSWRYGIVQDKASHKRKLVVLGGVFNFHNSSNALERVTDTTLNLAFWERILRVGSIKITEGGSTDAHTIAHIPNPRGLKRAIGT